MTRFVSQSETVSANRTEQTGTNGPVSHSAQAENNADNSNSVLPIGEPALLHELVKAIRTISYGSIVLTIHEGQLVEISKTTRLRRLSVSRKE